MRYLIILKLNVFKNSYQKFYNNDIIKEQINCALLFFGVKQMVIVCDETSVLKDYLLKMYSKKYVRYLKRQNAKFYINGRLSRLHEMVNCLDEIKIEFERITNKEEKLFDYDLNIIFKNDDFMVVNKPSGLNTIPSKNEPICSLYNAIYTYLLKNNSLETIHIITRLDKDTAGLVLVALNKETALFLNKNHHNIHKIYYAETEGIIEENDFLIDKPIKKSDDSTKRIISPDGKRSLTHVTVLKRKTNSTIVKINLLTGRTHQIRVHMSSILHPLIGDVLYGNKADFLHLSCQSISFSINEKNYTFNLEPPVWMIA